MPDAMEQRHPYEGDPERAWIMVRLAAKDGQTKELKLVADTGNPFAIILDPDDLATLGHEDGPEIETNFGVLEGSWYLVAMPELGLSQKIFGYGSGEVLNFVKASDASFAGLAGLPLLRLLAYGGDAKEFWIRRPT